MARIRTIKPEFPHSESMGRVSREARLLFIQLWTLADDSGRLRGNSRILASLLYPYDDDAKDCIDDWLADLENEDCIARYVVDGSTYLEILHWTEHQRIDKPTASKLPAFEDGSRILANPREPSNGEGKGPVPVKEGKGASARAKPKKRASQLPSNFEVTEDMRAWAAEKHGLVNGQIEAETERFCNHHTAKASTFVDWTAAWKTWIGRVNQFGNTGSTAPRKKTRYEQIYGTDDEEDHGSQ